MEKKLYSFFPSEESLPLVALAHRLQVSMSMAYNKPAGWHRTSANDEAWRAALSFFPVYFFSSSSLSSSLFFLSFQVVCCCSPLIKAFPSSCLFVLVSYAMSTAINPHHLSTHLRSVATQILLHPTFSSK